MAANAKVEFSLAKVKETKTMKRFSAGEDHPSSIGDVYVRNDKLEELGDPDSIKVTIEKG